MHRSHAADWGPKAPTPAQLKEFFAQIESGRITKAGLQILLRGTSIIDCDAKPFAPKDWKVEEHTNGGQLEWDPNGVSFYLSKKQEGDSAIEGNELYKELKGKPVFNANVLDYLLAYPYLIPEEWKSKRIFFWGTIYRYPNGDLSVRFLYWDDDRWGWLGHWLGYDFSHGDPAAFVV